MTYRQYDSKDVASIYTEVRPKPPKALIDAILTQLKSGCPPDSNGKWPRAVDVGCGSGQATFMLSESFNEVIGVDISEPQICEAERLNESPNVTFMVCPGEQIPLEDSTVQLIVACESLHFLDIDKFNEQVNRLLTPKGVFAAIGYYPVPVFTKSDDPSFQSNKLGDLIERAMSTWEDGGFPVKVFVEQINTKYRYIKLPFDRVFYENTFKTTITRPASYVIDLISSIGTSDKFKMKYPEKSHVLMDGIIRDIQQIFGVKDISTVELDATFEFFVVLFRK